LFVTKALSSKKEPKCFIKTDEIIYDHTQLYSNLKITYNNQDLPRFSSSKIIFWNDGKKSIRNTDIPSMAQPTITVTSNVQILSSSIIYVTNSLNNSSLQ
jgi:hypothetical protein